MAGTTPDGGILLIHASKPEFITLRDKLITIYPLTASPQQEIIDNRRVSELSRARKANDELAAKVVSLPKTIDDLRRSYRERAELANERFREIERLKSELADQKNANRAFVARVSELTLALKKIRRCSWLPDRSAGTTSGAGRLRCLGVPGTRMESE
jgi:hypothetical protein